MVVHESSIRPLRVMPAIANPFSFFRRTSAEIPNTILVMQMPKERNKNMMVPVNEKVAKPISRVMYDAIDSKKHSKLLPELSDLFPENRSLMRGKMVLKLRLRDGKGSATGGRVESAGNCMVIGPLGKAANESTG